MEIGKGNVANIPWELMTTEMSRYIPPLNWKNKGNKRAMLITQRKKFLCRELMQKKVKMNVENSKEIVVARLDLASRVGSAST